MNNQKRKALIIQISAILIACIVVFVVILYARGSFDFTFITRPETSSTSSEQTRSVNTDNLIDNISPETNESEGKITFPKYSESIKNIKTLKNSKNKTVYPSLWDESCEIVLSNNKNSFGKEFSIRQTSKRTIETETDKKGSIISSEKYEDGDNPVLSLYYGYILWDNGEEIALCNSKGDILLSDISSYELVNKCDLAGNPLFKKDDKYYIYYNGKSLAPGTVVSQINHIDISLSSVSVVPDSYDMIDDTYEIISSLSSSGMIECHPDETYFDNLSLNSRYEESTNSELFRFYEHRIKRTVINQNEIDRVNDLIARQQAAISGGTSKGNQTVDTTPITPVEPIYNETDEGIFWGYLNSDGTIAIEPQYAKAFDFSDGYAVINDTSDTSNKRMCIINSSGKTVINAYKSLIYIVERANAPMRDGYYYPDTYGIESIGSYKFEYSLLRVRRKLLDTTNSNNVASETSSIISTNGKLFNIPNGYKLIGYSDGMLLLEKNGLYGYMNYLGKWIVQPNYSYAEPFIEGLAVVGFDNGIRCMIDTNGEIVLPMIYNYISPVSNGVIVAFSEGHGWTIYNKISTNEYSPDINPILKIKSIKIAKSLAQTITTQATETIQPEEED